MSWIQLCTDIRECKALLVTENLYVAAEFLERAVNQSWIGLFPLVKHSLSEQTLELPLVAHWFQTLEGQKRVSMLFINWGRDDLSNRLVTATVRQPYLSFLPPFDKRFTRSRCFCLETNGGPSSFAWCAVADSAFGDWIVFTCQTPLIIYWSVCPNFSLKWPVWCFKL